MLQNLECGKLKELGKLMGSNGTVTGMRRLSNLVAFIMGFNFQTCEKN